MAIAPVLIRGETREMSFLITWTKDFRQVTGRLLKLNDRSLTFPVDDGS